MPAHNQKCISILPNRRLSIFSISIVACRLLLDTCYLLVTYLLLDTCYLLVTYLLLT